jgi:hypothetical protein
MSAHRSGNSTHTPSNNSSSFGNGSDKRCFASGEVNDCASKVDKCNIGLINSVFDIAIKSRRYALRCHSKTEAPTAKGCRGFVEELW